MCVLDPETLYSYFETEYCSADSRCGMCKPRLLQSIDSETIRAAQHQREFRRTRSQEQV